MTGITIIRPSKFQDRDDMGITVSPEEGEPLKFALGEMLLEELRPAPGEQYELYAAWLERVADKIRAHARKNGLLA